MAIYTAGDQINRALRLLGILAEGETPSAATSQDALVALNQMIESWSIERLSVFCTQDQIFTWPAGEYIRTLGPSGNFVGLRPVLLDDATYYRDPGTNVSFGIKFINQQQYDGIAVKTVTSTYPQVCFVNMGFPDITMSIYPRPHGTWNGISYRCKNWIGLLNCQPHCCSHRATCGRSPTAWQWSLHPSLVSNPAPKCSVLP